MANWRDIKATHRDKIHGAFAVPAVYLPRVGVAPVRVHVRDHTEPTATRFDPDGTMLEEAPALVLDIREVAMPERHAYVIFSATEIYSLGVAHAARGHFRRVECERLPGDDCATLVAAIGDVSGVAIWEGILP